MPKEETATCRWCRKELRGKPFYMGGRAYHPETGDQVKVNFYGGFVCSSQCDHRASLELEQSMPGHGYGQARLGCFAQRSFDQNWNQQSIA